MAERLPTKLEKEPLLDTLFEIRFSSKVSAASILPGIFFGKLLGEKTIEQQPAAQLPKQMRDADPNLQFAPLVRVLWNDYILLIGDRNVAVASKMPYPGWTKFRNAIIDVLNILNEANIIDSIQRYSLKYVDLLPFSNLNEQVSSVTLNVKLGSHVLEKEIFQLRIEIPQDEFINAVQLISSALVTTQDQTTRQGLIVEIDTICNISNEQFSSFMQELENKLNVIHQKNKEMFFKCLTPKTLKYMVPTYE